MPTPQLLEVTVEQGALQGQRIIPEDGSRRYDAFCGIPYAQPPVGPLRFKAPRPPQPWKGVRPALEEGPVAPQRDMLSGPDPVGDEDCLYLNVYTPQVPSSMSEKPAKRASGSPWPIMVWIHPGGFVGGSGNRRDYSPDLLVGKDVVVVTINYRLGALGFLSLESPAATGNYGLKDAVAAIRWVKANGAVFGGDTDRITIFGCSAGAGMVQLIQLSPLAKGLFHRAIAQSGGSINPWSQLIHGTARERALRLARHLGATDSDLADDNAILEFLRGQSPAALIDGATKIVTKEDYQYGVTFMFLPVCEEKIVSDDPQDEPFLPGVPRELLEKGRVCDVPLIIGFTDKEGIIMDVLSDAEHGVKAVPEVFARYDKNLELLFPRAVRDGLPPEKLQEATDRLRQLYFGGGAVSEATRTGWYDLQSDRMFHIGILQEARIRAKKLTSPVFVYSFGVKGRINRISQLLGKPPAEFLGACHGDELSYQWNTAPPAPLIPKLEPDSLEALTRERLVTLWTNFAKTGNPTPDGADVEGVHWPRLPKDVGSTIPYLDFGVDLTVPSSGIIQERVQFWDWLYSQVKN